MATPVVSAGGGPSVRLHLLCMLLFACLASAPTKVASAIVPHADVAGLVGDHIKLPCDVDRGRCGDLHSIKWYRGSSRIYVFSDMAGIARPEGEYAERAELSYDPNVTRTYLQLGQLTLADEAVYKCELTFLEVRDGCPVVQFVNLTALIKPEYVKITKGDGSSIQNSSLIGPFPEDEKLELVCESGGGKPLPAISWWNGSRLIPSKAEVENAPGGSSKSRSKISLKLGRGDLGAKYECRVASPALGDQGGMVLSWVEVDVHVRPRKLELGGVEHHVVQGTEVTLRCHVSGARPAANVTWYNGTEVIPTDNVLSDAAVQPPETKVQTSSDGTYETQSRFSFRATRYENGGSISCEATNPVIQAKGEQPMKSTIALEVLYPPIAWVSPDNATLNETSDVSIVCSYEANPPTPKEIIWYRDGKELVLDGERLEIAETESFQGKEPGQSPWGRSILSIKNASRDDGGAYSCMPENEVGSSESTNQAYVSVYFKPEVKLMMDPLTPVSEIDKLNITLLCRVEAGNPETLLSVRWYLDGELLKELPDCRGNDSSEANSSDDSLFCDIDPSKLLLEDVSRSFHGNYSCEGMNEAGWGPLSPEEELIVHYPPGPATLVYDPPQVLKKSWVTLSCSVEDPGRPEATPNSFKWFRGGHPVIDVTTANWTIEPVTLETQSNFTCLAANAGGEGEPATVYVEVAAPPAFIERLPPYHGALMHAEHVSVSCRVECSPICQVRWLKNGRPLVEDGPQSSLYSIRTSELPPDPRTNDFKSVVSTLLWNMSAWPGGRLDRILDNANYTCESTANAVGPGVTSTTFFGVEYPPENITVSPQIVSVVEGQIPDKIVCSAKAYPEASYHWWRRRQSDNDGSSSNNLVIDPQTSSIVVKGNALVLNYPVPRTDGGEYICEAYNRHGNATIKTHVNVLHKPECGITQTEVNGKLVLICRASANPAEVDFFWRIKNGSENETVEENVESGGPLSSILTLETRVENFRTYLCFANNSVGMSIPCERDVTVSQSWWKKLENDNVLIIVAIIVGAVVMVIIVCIIIIIVCRRRRAEDKYPSLSATRDKSNQGKTPDGNMGGSQPDDDRAFYENLPFHGLQNPPNKVTSTNSTSPFSISMGQQWQQHPNSNNCGSLHRGSNRSASHANSRGIGVGRTGAESSILTPIAPVPTLCPPGGQQSCPPQQILRPKPQHHHSREWGDPRRMATESLHSNRPANATNSLTRNGVDHYAGNGSTHRHRHAAESPISMHTLPHQKKNHHHHSGGNNQHIPAYNDSAATTAMSAAGGIMYADLSLRANGYPSGGPMAKGRGGMATSVGDRNSTEYAVLKFHDVGQEIDV